MLAAQVDLSAFAAEPAKMSHEEIERLQHFVDAPSLRPVGGKI